MIILKAIKKSGLPLSLEDSFLEKPHKENPQPFKALSVKHQI